MWGTWWDSLRKRPNSPPAPCQHREQPQGSRTGHIPAGCQYSWSKGWSGPRSAPWRCCPTLATSPPTTGALAAFLGFYQPDRKLWKRGWTFAALYTDWKCCAGEQRGERSWWQMSALLWGSGLLLCSFCYSRGALQPVGAPELVQKVWSVLGWESSCNCHSLDVVFNTSEVSPGVWHSPCLQVP